MSLATFGSVRAFILFCIFLWSGSVFAHPTTQIESGLERLARRFQVSIETEMSIPTDAPTHGSFFNFYPFGDYGILVPLSGVEAELDWESTLKLEERMNFTRRAERLGGPKLLGISILDGVAGIKVELAHGEHPVDLDEDSKDEGDPDHAERYFLFLGESVRAGYFPSDAHIGNILDDGNRMQPIDVEYVRPTEFASLQGDYFLAANQDKGKRHTFATAGRARSILRSSRREAPFCLQVLRQLREMSRPH